MLITCTNCKSKIRVPEKALGKRVKCPKCATTLQVPESDTPEGSEGESPSTSISKTPLPAPPEPIPPEEPDEHIEDGDETEVTATLPSSKPGAKPPPVKTTSKRASTFDDGDDEDEDEDVDKRKSKRKRRRDLDDDDFDVRRRDRRDQPMGVNSFAMTSMILGILSLVTVFGSCCCGPVSVLAILFAVLAIIFGFMGKTPGSETYAWIGIGCGIAALVFAVISIAFVLLSIGMNGMMQFNNMNQPRRF